MKEARTVRLLLPLLRNQGWALPATVVLGIVSSLAETIGLSLFVPLFQSLDRRLDQGGDSNGLQGFFHVVLRHLPSGNPLPYIVALILIMTACKGALTFAHSILAARMGARVTHGLRSRVFSKMMGISQRRLDETGTGRLVNLLATDTWHTGDAIALFIGLAINLCSMAVFAVLLVALSWKLTLLVIGGVAVVSATIQTVTHGARQLGKEGLEANTVMSEHMLDALEGLREIQMFNLRAYRQQLFDSVSSRVRAIYFRLDWLHRTAAPLAEVLYVSLLLGLLLIGVAAHGSVPSIIVFLLVLYRLQPQIRQVDAARLNLVSLTTPVEEVTRFINSADEMRIESAAPAREFTRAIEFEDVSFAYDVEAEFRMENISFRIPFGSTTAIVGRSGSGKSTIVRLLCRFYEPLSGTIRVDERPLSRLDVDDWRGQVAWVSQDAHLFRASIRENIRYGRLDASDDDILAAALQADVDGFVAPLPDGYETRVGSGGTELSSGQVQRIALARAFVRRPAILILDEATNSLDSLSEESIRERLEQMAGQHTVVVISHRLSTVRNADHVIVLEGGRISEQGAPRELSRQRGFFSKVRELQHVD